MNKSSFGSHFTVTTWGESHGKALGAVIDGCPAGLSLSEEDIQKFLDRRKPGQSRYTTARKEGDLVEILSGVFEGKTTGTPISLMVRNTDQRSRDYGNIAYSYRPGHADYTFDAKYGFRDYRGGGRSSGRETIGRVASGAVASRLLASLGISFCTYTKSIGPVSIKEYNPEEINNNAFYMPDADAAAKAGTYLEECMKNQDSAGGVIECRISGVPAGLGNPVFEKLDAMLSQAVMSVGAVKAVEIGDGIQVAHMKGSEDNDGFLIRDNVILKLPIMPVVLWAESVTAARSSFAPTSSQHLQSVSLSRRSPARVNRFPLKYMADMILSLSREQLLLSNPCVPSPLQMHYLLI